MNPYTIALIGIAIAMGVLTIYSWLKRDVRGSLALGWVLLSVAVWTLAYGFELASLDLPSMLFWLRVEYLGIASAPVLWLFFVLQYSGQEGWLTSRSRTALFVIPVITLVLNWTNSWHHVYYSSVTVNSTGSFPTLILERGVWYWVNVAYTYALHALGTAALIHSFLWASELPRRQISVILVGSLAPLLGNMLYLTGLVSLPNLDLTPFMFSVTGISLALGVFSFEMLNVVPIAYERVIQSLSDGVIVLDSEARIVEINSSAQHLFESLGPGIIGRPVKQILPDCVGLLEKVSQASSVHRQVTLARDDTLGYYDLEISAISGRRGRLVGWLVVLHDLTGRAEFERELQQAKIAAEAASHAKSAFIANVSHELGTPLASVMIYIETVLKGKPGPLTEDQRRFLEISYRSARQLSGLVNDLLDTSVLVREDRIVLRVEPVELRSFIGDLALDTRRSGSGGHPRIELEVPEHPYVIVADRNRLAQVFGHLLLNAIQSTSEDGCVTLILQPTPEGHDLRGEHLSGAGAHIQVRDTGAGIPPEELSQVFERFRQLDAVDDESIGDIGLGLFIAHELVKAHGGRIWVESQVGRGSTFHVWLPAYQPAVGQSIA